MTETATTKRGVGMDAGSGDSKGVNVLNLYRRLQMVKPEERKGEIILFLERRAGTADLERVLTEGEKKALVDMNDSVYVAAVYLMTPEEQKTIYHHVKFLETERIHYLKEESKWMDYCFERVMEKTGIHDKRHPKVFEAFCKDWFDENHSSGRYRAFYGLKYPEKIRVE
ncbi:MAG: hypothetical protein WCK90_00735 [archaeon]